MFSSSNLLSAFLALSAYVAIMGALLFYFNTKDVKKPIHYVKKSEERISVKIVNKSPSSDKAKAEKKEVKRVPKVKTEKSATIEKPKTSTKKIIKKATKEKVKKIKKLKVFKDINKTNRLKKRSPNLLFANVKSSKSSSSKPKKKEKKSHVKSTASKEPTVKSKDIKKVSASDLVANNISSDKKRDKGIEDRYIAKIESMLDGWMAQSEYAGQSATIHFTVYSSGNFTSKMLSASANPSFNLGLIEYVEQLKKIGFGTHKRESPYTISVEFKAND